TSADVALSAITGQRPNQVLADPYGDRSPRNYLNPSAFAAPVTGTLGNVGSYSVTGPTTWQFDLALSRIFKLGEVQKLELRAEAFNVTNSTHLGDPVVAFNSSTFGQILSAKDPRIMQFALKYVF